VSTRAKSASSIIVSHARKRLFKRPPTAATNGDNQAEGVVGGMGAGAREVSYRLMFIACSAQSAGTRDGMVNIRGDNELETPAEVLDQFSERDAQVGPGRCGWLGGVVCRCRSRGWGWGCSLDGRSLGVGASAGLHSVHTDC